MKGDKLKLLLESMMAGGKLSFDEAWKIYEDSFKAAKIDETYFRDYIQSQIEDADLNNEPIDHNIPAPALITDEKTRQERQEIHRGVLDMMRNDTKRRTENYTAVFNHDGSLERHMYLFLRSTKSPEDGEYRYDDKIDQLFGSRSSATVEEKGAFMTRKLAGVLQRLDIEKLAEPKSDREFYEYYRDPQRMDDITFLFEDAFVNSENLQRYGVDPRIGEHYRDIQQRLYGYLTRDLNRLAYMANPLYPYHTIEAISKVEYLRQDLDYNGENPRFHTSPDRMARERTGIDTGSAKTLLGLSSVDINEFAGFGVQTMVEINIEQIIRSYGYSAENRFNLWPDLIKEGGMLKLPEGTIPDDKMEIAMELTAGSVFLLRNPKNMENEPGILLKLDEKGNLMYAEAPQFTRFLTDLNGQKIVYDPGEVPPEPEDKKSPEHAEWDKLNNAKNAYFDYCLAHKGYPGVTKAEADYQLEEALEQMKPITQHPLGHYVLEQADKTLTNETLQKIAEESERNYQRTVIQGRNLKNVPADFDKFLDTTGQALSVGSEIMGRINQAENAENREAKLQAEQDIRNSIDEQLAIRLAGRMARRMVEGLPQPAADNEAEIESDKELINYLAEPDTIRRMAEEIRSNDVYKQMMEELTGPEALSTHFGELKVLLTDETILDMKTTNFCRSVYEKIQNIPEGERTDFQYTVGSIIQAADEERKLQDQRHAADDYTAKAARNFYDNEQKEVEMDPDDYENKRLDALTDLMAGAYTADKIYQEYKAGILTSEKAEELNNQRETFREQLADDPAFIEIVRTLHFSEHELEELRKEPILHSSVLVEKYNQQKQIQFDKLNQDGVEMQNFVNNLLDTAPENPDAGQPGADIHPEPEILLREDIRPQVEVQPQADPARPYRPVTDSAKELYAVWHKYPHYEASINLNVLSDLKRIYTVEDNKLVRPFYSQDLQRRLDSGEPYPQNELLQQKFNTEYLSTHPFYVFQPGEATPVKMELRTDPETGHLSFLRQKPTQDELFEFAVSQVSEHRKTESRDEAELHAIHTVLDQEESIMEAYRGIYAKNVPYYYPENRRNLSYTENYGPQMSADSNVGQADISPLTEDDYIFLTISSFGVPETSEHRKNQQGYNAYNDITHVTSTITAGRVNIQSAQQWVKNGRKLTARAVRAIHDRNDYTLAGRILAEGLKNFTNAARPSALQSTSLILGDAKRSDMFTAKKMLELLHSKPEYMAAAKKAGLKQDTIDQLEASVQIYQAEKKDLQLRCDVLEGRIRTPEQIKETVLELVMHDMMKKCYVDTMQKAFQERSEKLPQDLDAADIQTTLADMEKNEPAREIEKMLANPDQRRRFREQVARMPETRKLLKEIDSLTKLRKEINVSGIINKEHAGDSILVSTVNSMAGQLEKGIDLNAEAEQFKAASDVFADNFMARQTVQMTMMQTALERVQKANRELRQNDGYKNARELGEYTTELRKLREAVKIYKAYKGKSADMKPGRSQRRAEAAEQLHEFLNNEIRIADYRYSLISKTDLKPGYNTVEESVSMLADNMAVLAEKHPDHKRLIYMGTAARDGIANLKKFQRSYQDASPDEQEILQKSVAAVTVALCASKTPEIWQTIDKRNYGAVLNKTTQTLVNAGIFDELESTADLLRMDETKLLGIVNRQLAREQQPVNENQRQPDEPAPAHPEPTAPRIPF